MLKTCLKILGALSALLIAVPMMLALAAAQMGAVAPPLQMAAPSQLPPAPSDVTIVGQRANMFEAQATYLQSVINLREHQWAEYSRPLWDFAPKAELPQHERK